MGEGAEVVGAGVVLAGLGEAVVVVTEGDGGLSPVHPTRASAETNDTMVTRCDGPMTTSHLDGTPARARPSAARV